MFIEVETKSGPMLINIDSIRSISKEGKLVFNSYGYNDGIKLNESYESIKAKIAMAYSLVDDSVYEIGNDK